jgi:hypothetical protein
MAAFWSFALQVWSRKWIKLIACSDMPSSALRGVITPGFFSGKNH